MATEVRVDGWGCGALPLSYLQRGILVDVPRHQLVLLAELLGEGALLLLPERLECASRLRGEGVGRVRDVWRVGCAVG
jgi:hypothetical protein